MPGLLRVDVKRSRHPVLVHIARCVMDTGEQFHPLKFLHCHESDGISSHARGSCIPSSHSQHVQGVWNVGT